MISVQSARVICCEIWAKTQLIVKPGLKSSATTKQWDMFMEADYHTHQMATYAIVIGTYKKILFLLNS